MGGFPRGQNMSARRDTMTSLIRSSALTELNRLGCSALTMEAVARASFCSIGSVYARFDSRSALFSDLLQSRVAPAIRDLADTTRPRGQVLRSLIEGDLSAETAALVELVLASRHDPAIRADAGLAVSTLSSSIDTGGDEGIRWLVVAVVLGCHFLTAAGCNVPELTADLDAFLTRMIECSGSPPRLTTAAQLSVTNPVSPVPKSSDDIAEALNAEARRALAESGLAGANIKTIAERTGVTTGAVYRRYDSKNELINDAVVRELSPKRYEWTTALAGSFVDDRQGTPADVLADQVLALLSHRENALATLEMIHAARVDPGVRATLTTQFANAADSRRQMFEQLRDSGAAHSDINCSLIGWLIQTAPAGARILLSLDMVPTEEELRRGLRAVVAAILGD